MHNFFVDLLETNVLKIWSTQVASQYRLKWILHGSKESSKSSRTKRKETGGCSQSGERSVNTTIICCVIAGGQIIPPKIIFKKARMMPQLTVSTPAGSYVAVTDYSYINLENQIRKKGPSAPGRPFKSQQKPKGFAFSSCL